MHTSTITDGLKTREPCSRNRSICNVQALDGSESELPPPGSPVTLDGREVGRVTSSARHYELGPIALAVVKRSTDAGAALVAGGVAAGQEAVVAA